VIPAAGRLDRAAAAIIWRRRTPRTVATARLVGVLGDPAIAYPATIVACLLAPAGGRHSRHARLPPLAVLMLAAALRRIGCDLIARPRPPQPVRLVTVDGHSLPSRHTTLAVLAAGAVVRAAGTPAAGRLAVPAAVGAAVGTARVLLGAHWPGDVLAGLGVGLAGCWAADRAAGRRVRQQVQHRRSLASGRSGPCRVRALACRSRRAGSVSPVIESAWRVCRTLTPRHVRA